MLGVQTINRRILITLLITRRSKIGYSGYQVWLGCSYSWSDSAYVWITGPTLTYYPTNKQVKDFQTYCYSDNSKDWRSTGFKNLNFHSICMSDASAFIVPTELFLTPSVISNTAERTQEKMLSIVINSFFQMLKLAKL